MKKLATNNNTTLQFFLTFSRTLLTKKSKTLSLFFYLKTFNSYIHSTTFHHCTIEKHPDQKKLIRN